MRVVVVDTRELGSLDTGPPHVHACRRARSRYHRVSLCGLWRVQYSANRCMDIAIGTAQRIMACMDVSLQFDPYSREPLYMQLAQALATAIEAGEIGHGERL